MHSLLILLILLFPSIAMSSRLATRNIAYFTYPSSGSWYTDPDIIAGFDFNITSEGRPVFDAVLHDMWYDSNTTISVIATVPPYNHTMRLHFDRTSHYSLSLYNLELYTVTYPSNNTATAVQRILMDTIDFYVDLNNVTGSTVVPTPTSFTATSYTPTSTPSSPLNTLVAASSASRSRHSYRDPHLLLFRFFSALVVALTFVF